MSVAGPDRIEAWLDNELSDDGFAEFEDWLRSDPANIETFARAGVLHRRLRDVLRAQAVELESEAEPPVIKLSPLPSPLSPPFVGGPVFSYMVASVILCMMLLGGWVYKVSHVGNLPGDMANNPQNRQQYTPVVIGQVTGMKDCLWGKDEPGTIIGASVPLGRKYSLESGLLQITYKTGARVILEGPCTYKVDSKVGGYLRLGKLTARVEGAKPQASSDPQSPIPNPLFTVTTPTAIVTDLGTEFGVKVSGNGDTVSRVFLGSVKVRTAGNASHDSLILHADESARVRKEKDSATINLISGDGIADAPKFVRRLYEPPKYVDLLDIVAGGNGLGNHRECGIDPETGTQDTAFLPVYRQTDGKYHRPKFLPLIDGVFMPDADFGPVQLDSAGHTYEGFPKAIEPGTFASIWARAAEVPADKQNKWETPKEIGQYWIYAAPFGPEFMPERRGLLAMCAGSGITFDLSAIRKAHAGRPLVHFRATAGKASPSLAEMFVFVDGQLAWKSGVISDCSGVKRVDVPIRSTDRFLTLVTIEANDGRGSDWTVFGDPVLECLDSEQENSEKEDDSMNGS